MEIPILRMIPRAIVQLNVCIKRKKLLEFKKLIMSGQVGIKPGWARLNFHFLLTEAEFQFIGDAISFVAQYGKYFLQLYRFDIHTGKWRYNGYAEEKITFGLDEALQRWEEKEETITFGIDEALAIEDVKPKTDYKTALELYPVYLEQAHKLALELTSNFNEAEIETTEANLIPFV